MSLPFAIDIRVYYEDTDAGGVVYYANYLRFMERARTEWLRARGIELDRVAAQQGVLFAVRSIQVNYVKPARLNDSLAVSVSLENCGRASMSLYQEVRKADMSVCSGNVEIVCVDAENFNPRRIPPHIVTAVSEWAA